MSLKIITGHIPHKEIPCPDLTNFVFPENGRHPDEVLDFCKWIVELSKNTDITVFTYAHYVIESLDVWAEFLNTKVEFYFYNKDGEIKKIKNNKLYIIYADLGEMLDEIDRIRLRMKMREE